MFTQGVIFAYLVKVFLFTVFLKEILIQEKSRRRDQKILRKYCSYVHCVLTSYNTLCPCHFVKNVSC